MEQQLLTVEAFAHYMRGAITLFFVFWCFKLYLYRRRNRMMRLLFYATIFLAFSHIKDSVFLFVQWKNSIWLDDLINTIHQSRLSYSPPVSCGVVHAGVVHTAILGFPR